MLKIKLIAALFVLPMAVCNASSITLISGSISDSLTASSDSISNSSKSSSNAVKTAEGDYKVIDVADAAGHPNQKRVALQAMTQGKEGLYLYMTKDELAQSDLRAGQVVTANPRPYGVAFTQHGNNNGTFAVVLNDLWLKELNPTQVAI